MVCRYIRYSGTGISSSHILKFICYAISYVQESSETNTSPTVKAETRVGKKHLMKPKTFQIRQLRNFYAENS